MKASFQPGDILLRKPSYTPIEEGDDWPEKFTLLKMEWLGEGRNEEDFVVGTGRYINSVGKTIVFTFDNLPALVRYFTKTGEETLPKILYAQEETKTKRRVCSRKVI